MLAKFSFYNFTIPLIFQLSMVTQSLGEGFGEVFFFFSDYLWMCVCIYLYRYLYLWRGICLLSLYTLAHTEPHIHGCMCIKCTDRTRLKISPCKTSLETDLAENGLLSTNLFEVFCYLVLLFTTLWYLLLPIEGSRCVNLQLLGSLCCIHH